MSRWRVANSLRWDQQQSVAARSPSVATGRFEMRGSGPRVDVSGEAGGGAISVRANDINVDSGTVTAQGGSTINCGDGGQVTFDAGGGPVIVASVIRASSPEGPCLGGSIEMTGQMVSISAEVDARGGGTASDDAIVVTAETGDVLLLGNARLRADGTGQVDGDGASGGGISIEATQGNVVAGGLPLSATGQSPGGSGGEIDLTAMGRVELTARTLLNGGSAGSGGRETILASGDIVVRGEISARGGSSDPEAQGGQVELRSGGDLLIDAPIDITGSNGGTVTGVAAEGSSLTSSILSRGSSIHGGRVDLTGCSSYISGTIDVRGLPGITPGSYRIEGASVEVASSAQLLAAPCTGACATIAAETATLSPSAVADPMPNVVSAQVACSPQ